MYSNQRTISKPVTCSGIGVHSAKKVNITIKPAPINHGIKFIRKDLPDCPSISATYNMVVDTSLATVIGYNGFIVSTIEHLMSCFSGLSIDNALVEMDSYEIPIMDGSAGPFTSLIKSAGTIEQDGLKYFFVIKKPIKLSKDGRSIAIYPMNRFKISYIIDYDHPLIQKQSYSIELNEQTFEHEISCARTFGFLDEYEYLKRYGLSQGCSLENVIVIGKNKILNSDGLRFKDEFVRHKILDCIGDLSLVGMPILGHVVAKKSGHAFNHALLKTFFEQKKSWDTCTINDLCDIPHFQSKPLSI